MIDFVDEKTVTARLQMPIGCNRLQLCPLDRAQKHQLNIGVGR